MIFKTALLVIVLFTFTNILFGQKRLVINRELDNAIERLQRKEDKKEVKKEVKKETQFILKETWGHCYEADPDSDRYVYETDEGETFSWNNYLKDRLSRKGAKNYLRQLKNEIVKTEIIENRNKTNITRVVTARKSENKVLYVIFYTNVYGNYWTFTGENYQLLLKFERFIFENNSFY